MAVLGPFFFVRVYDYAWYRSGRNKVKEIVSQSPRVLSDVESISPSYAASSEYISSPRKQNYMNATEYTQSSEILGVSERRQSIQESALSGKDAFNLLRQGFAVEELREAGFSAKEVTQSYFRIRGVYVLPHTKNVRF